MSAATGRKIPTKYPFAQGFFDQKLRLVYGYYFPEAIASFQEAQRYDPDYPMLGWGLALAVGPNPNSRKNTFTDDPHGDGRKVITITRAHEALLHCFRFAHKPEVRLFLPVSPFTRPI